MAAFDANAITAGLQQQQARSQQRQMTLGEIMNMRRQQQQAVLEQRQQQMRELEFQQRQRLQPYQEREAAANANRAELANQDDIEKATDSASMHAAFAQALKERKAQAMTGQSTQDQIGNIEGGALPVQPGGQGNTLKSVPARTQELLEESNPRAAYKYNAILLTQQEKQAQADRAKLEAQQKAYEIQSDTLRAYNEPAKYPALLNQLDALAAKDPQWQSARDEMPATYDKSVMDTLIQRGETAQQRNYEDQHAVAMRESQIKFAQNRVKPLGKYYQDGEQDPEYLQAMEVYNKAVKENGPKELELNTRIAADRLSHAVTPKEYEQLKQLLVDNGTPLDVIEKGTRAFPDKGSKQQVQAWQDEMRARANQVASPEVEAGLQIRRTEAANSGARVALAGDQDRYNDRIRGYNSYLGQIKAGNPTAKQQSEWEDRDRINQRRGNAREDPLPRTTASPFPQWQRETFGNELPEPGTRGQAGAPASALGGKATVSGRTLTGIVDASGASKPDQVFDTDKQRDDFLKAAGRSDLIPKAAPAAGAGGGVAPAAGGRTRAQPDATEPGDQSVLPPEQSELYGGATPPPDQPAAPPSPLAQAQPEDEELA